MFFMEVAPISIMKVAPVSVLELDKIAGMEKNEDVVCMNPLIPAAR